MVETAQEGAAASSPVPHSNSTPAEVKACAALSAAATMPVLPAPPSDAAVHLDHMADTEEAVSQAALVSADSVHTHSPAHWPAPSPTAAAAVSEAVAPTAVLGSCSIGEALRSRDSSSADSLGLKTSIILDQVIRATQ